MSDRLQQLLKLREADPSDPFLTYGIALEHVKAGELDQAIDWLDRTLSLDGSYHYAYFQKAKALDERGDTDAAIAVLKHGIGVAGQAGDEKAAGEMAELLETMT